MSDPVLVRGRGCGSVRGWVLGVYCGSIESYVFGGVPSGIVVPRRELKFGRCAIWRRLPARDVLPAGQLITDTVCTGPLSGQHGTALVFWDVQHGLLLRRGECCVHPVYVRELPGGGILPRRGSSCFRCAAVSCRNVWQRDGTHDARVLGCVCRAILLRRRCDIAHGGCLEYMPDRVLLRRAYARGPAVSTRGVGWYDGADNRRVQRRVHARLLLWLRVHIAHAVWAVNLPARQLLSDRERVARRGAAMRTRLFRQRLRADAAVVLGLVHCGLCLPCWIRGFHRRPQRWRLQHGDILPCGHGDTDSMPRGDVWQLNGPG